MHLNWSRFCTGVLGIKVKIMLPWDPTGKNGPKKPLPDNVSVVEPKEELPPPAAIVPTQDLRGLKTDVVTPGVPVMA